MRIAKMQTVPYTLKAAELAPGVPALTGVEITVLPVEPSMYLSAREAARRAYLKYMPDMAYTAPDETGAAEPARAEDLRAQERALRKAMQVFSLEIASMAIISWKGVDDEAGHPLPLTPEGLARAFTVIELFDFFDEKYVNPVRIVEAEKNVSSPSQNGTTGAKTRAKDTAATARRHARNAPTPSTPRKQGKESALGRH